MCQKLMKAKDFPAMNKKTPFSKKQIHLLLESHYSSLPVFKGGLQERWEETIRKCRGKIRDNVSELKDDGIRLDIRKKFLPVRVVKHWAVQPPSA